LAAIWAWLVSQVSARIDDYLIETTLTTVLAFGSYLVAEQFHTSGVLSVVAAGVVMRNLGLKKMSPTRKSFYSTSGNISLLSPIHSYFCLSVRKSTCGSFSRIYCR
jgi:NhaP-type Na+/H+ or K+/H+ antiporter